MPGEYEGLPGSAVAQRGAGLRTVGADIFEGTGLAPGFDDAVALHELLGAIWLSAAEAALVR